MAPKEGRESADESLAESPLALPEESPLTLARRSVLQRGSSDISAASSAFRVPEEPRKETKKNVIFRMASSAASTARSVKNAVSAVSDRQKKKLERRSARASTHQRPVHNRLLEYDEDHDMEEETETMGLGQQCKSIGRLSVCGVGDDPTSKLPPGAAAFLAHKEAQKASHGVAQQTAVNGVRFSPISKNYEKLNRQLQCAIIENQFKAEMSNVAASNLPHWFDIGLKLRDQGAGVEMKRPLPTDYEIAHWADEEVPLVRHINTGCIIWPVRYTILPWYGEEEGEGDGHRATQTVYHYTTAKGFKDLTSRFVTAKGQQIWEEVAFAQEVWDRIEDDLAVIEAQPVNGAPEESIALLSQSPDQFQNVLSLGQAVCRTRGEVAAGRAAYCVALLVPADRCLAAGARLAINTILIQAPGTDENDAFSEFADESDEDHKAHKLVRYAVRAKYLVNFREKIHHDSVSVSVKRMNLLEGLVDHHTGQVLPLEDEPEEVDDRKHQQQRRGLNNNNNNILLSTSQKLNDQTATRAEQEEPHQRGERLAREKLEQLEIQRDRAERKLQKSMAAQARFKAGLAVQQQQQQRFFDNDPLRVDKIQKYLIKMGARIEGAREEVKSWDPKVFRNSRRAALLKTMAEGKSPKDAGLAVMRKKGAYSDFARETTDVVHDICDEYFELAGDIFREVFGGNFQGVQSWLEAKGDVNEYHTGTGWTPVMMAVSQGDPGMVQLLADHKADLVKASLEQGWSPMHFAVHKTSTEIVHLVLNLNSDAAQEIAFDGTSTLLMATQKTPVRARDEVIRLLLESAADPNLKNDSGWSALTVAIVGNLRQAVKFMVTKRGNILDEIPQTDGETCWQRAGTFKGMQRMIKGKLKSKDLTAIEDRWPGTLVGPLKNDRGDASDDEG
ncbi:unnamed protein product [Polarella glacialis]|uniref:Uncharacterized protein n=1 Tax=Polarella glacialis TaxID=89957 RepID=A0A813LA44_POLGL|nr:unnamed protein product [Polarella glacialis]